jgi:hypothetical protein
MKQASNPLSFIQIRLTAHPDLFDVKFHETPIGEAIAALSNLTAEKYSLGTSAADAKGNVCLKVSSTSVDKIIPWICASSTSVLIVEKSGNTSFIELDTKSKGDKREVILPKPLDTLLPQKLKIIHEKRVENQPLEEQKVSFEAQNVPLRDALASYFGAFGIDFVLYLAVQGTSNISFSQRTFDNGLRLIMRQATIPLTYNKEGKIFFIQPRVVG